MDALRHFEAVYAEWEREVREAGERAGREAGERAGLIKGIETLCTAYHIDLSADRRQQLAAWDIEQLEEALVEIGTTRRWPGSH